MLNHPSRFFLASQELQSREDLCKKNQSLRVTGTPPITRATIVTTPVQPGTSWVSLMSDADYHAFQQHEQAVATTRARRFLVCVTAIAMSFGSHASMQALAPAESALASLGVTPFGYAALTVTPTALGLFSPPLWGRLWDNRRGLAYVLAPTGECLGACILAAGLYMHAKSAVGPLANLRMQHEIPTPN